jgi:xanthine permease XanP
MNEKPPGQLYGVDDKPPVTVVAALAVQHVFLMSSSLVMPVILVSEIGRGTAVAAATVAMSMIACGLGTIVQALRLPGIGSGFLCPNLVGPNFFTASMGAAWLGGLPLVRGMTIAAGLFELLFARFLQRLSSLFPPEITGLVIFMVAFGIVPLATSKFLGVNYAGDPIAPLSAAISVLTLLSMIAANAWGPSRLRLYSVLIGMGVGYGLCIVFGVVASLDLQAVQQAPWFGIPHYNHMWQFSFQWSLLPAWMIVSACGALKSLGNLVLCEKVNDANWTRPNIARIGNGLTADAFSVIVSGVLGGLASDTSSSNVAFSSVSGATSRWIAFAVGALFFALGFSPKLTTLLSIMPGPVAGAILVFVVCFMALSGLQIIAGTQIDSRKTFVIGVALIFGMSLDVMPGLYAHVYPWMRPVFNSSLTLAAAVAVLLNQFLRIRTSQAATS